MADAAALEAQGRLEEALSAYARGQQWEAAARVALGLDRNLEAARFFLRAQRPYDAAVCFQKAGAPKDCLSALQRVPSASPRYRSACVHALRVAQVLGTPLGSLSLFLKPFTSTRPTSPVEAAALNQLAAECAKTGQLQLAKALYGNVLLAYPGDAEAAAGQKDLAHRAARQAPALSPPAGTARGAAPSGPAAPQGAPRLRAVGLGPLLVARGTVKQPQLDLVLRERPELARSDVLLGEALVAKGWVGEVPVVQALSELSDIPWLPEEKLLAQASPEAARTLTLEQAEKWQVVPISLADRQLHVAMRNPRDFSLIDQVRFGSGVNQVIAVFATDTAIRRGIVKLYVDAPEPRGAADAAAVAQAPRQRAPTIAHPAPAAVPSRASAPPVEAPAPPADRRAPIEVSGWDAAPSPEVPAAAGERHAAIEVPGWDSPQEPAAPAPPDTRHAPIEIPDWDGPAPAEAPSAAADGYISVSARDFDPEDLERRMQDEASPGEPGDAPAEAAPQAVVLPRQPPLVLGSKFGERYRLDALLGEGGSATIFKAFDLEINESVALKVFRPGTQAEAEQLLSRFKLELALSRQLAHQNIIRLFDLGAHEGWRYLTMELLEGRDLAQVIGDSGQPLDLVDGLRVLEQTCAGLQFVHDQDVVHRDVKPQNVFITRDGRVKLMDFGIAKRLHGAGVTVAGMVLGTPSFISPEQIKSFSSVTHLSDLYSLGAMAYAVFTGQPPFVHPELIGLLMSHANDLPAPPRLKHPRIPAELEAVVLSLLEKDPARRLQSAAAVGAALRAIRERLERG